MSDDKHEIVIIRRGGHGDHDDHHGGVWKIAFADFMTAMMAFFLVMWLISANDKTRATIARYFNPVKLVEATIRPPGLHDPKSTDGSQSAGHESAEDKNAADKSSGGKDPGHKEPDGPPPNETPKGREARLDAKLRTNPYVALAEIAGEKGASDVPPKDAPRGSAPVIGRKGGTAFRDPFAPPATPVEAADKEIDVSEIVPPHAASRPSSSEVDQKLASASKEPAVTPPAAPSAKPDEKQVLTNQLAITLKDQSLDKTGPDLSVNKTSEGYLISLTDTSDFSMFGNGSAVPSKRVVLMMAEVAKVLAKRPGGVIIRGYTDNKPFKSKRYDNWNLSIDRAQAAHYMLVRGGLDEARIAGVEGFADRKGAAAGVDPGSPLNRRIEILVREDGK